MSLKAVAEALAELKRRESENRLSYYAPYPKQREFHAAGAKYRQRLLMAGNQVGKSLSASAEVAMHLTGNYPDWWQGKRFIKPIKAWAAGVTGLSTRDNCQRLLTGDVGALGTGMIPKDCILNVTKSKGAPDSIDNVQVKHKSGGKSVLWFKSYELGREKFQGPTIDVIWGDEEMPGDIWSEMLARTAASGGSVLTTFTPIAGMSEVVLQFLQDESTLRHVVQMSIDDAPHFDAEKRAALLEMYPEFERDARLRGIPMLGSGRVFNVSEDELKIEPIPLPSHWPRICGIDLGVAHPFAAAWLAWDRDADIVYLYDTYRQSRETLAMHAAAIKSRGKWIPVAWPHDALQTDRVSCKSIVDILKRDHDVKALSHMATFEGGGNGVEAGIQLMLDRMVTQRFRVFSTCTDWFEEYRLYHRKDGKLQKIRDDLLSASRYALMMLRHAKTSDGVKDWNRPIKYPASNHLRWVV